MNHWLRQLTPSKDRSLRVPPLRRADKHPRKCHSPATERVHQLVKRQPLGAWFSASDVFDGSVCSVDYVRKILKGMVSQGELVAEFRAEISPRVDQPDQHYNKWMFKREK